MLSLYLVLFDVYAAAHARNVSTVQQDVTQQMHDSETTRCDTSMLDTAIVTTALMYVHLKTACWGHQNTWKHDYKASRKRTHLRNMYTLLTVYPRALNTQQCSQIEGCPVRLRRPAVTADTIAWYPPENVHRAVGGSSPCKELARALRWQHALQHRTRHSKCHRLSSCLPLVGLFKDQKHKKSQSSNHSQCCAPSPLMQYKAATQKAICEDSILVSGTSQVRQNESSILSGDTHFMLTSKPGLLIDTALATAQQNTSAGRPLVPVH